MFFRIIIFISIVPILSTQPLSNTELECLNKCGQNEPFFPSERMIGGTEATEKSQPWIVRIQVTQFCGTPPMKLQVRNYACTGFIIGQKHVLSAAHCFYSDLHRTNDLCRIAAEATGIDLDKWQKIRLQDIRIYADRYDWDDRQYFNWRFHEVTKLEFGAGFDPDLKDKNAQSSDYVLMTVSPDFVFAEGVRKICVPTPIVGLFTTVLNLPTYTHAGWGLANEETQTDAGTMTMSTQNHLNEQTSNVQPTSYCSSIYGDSNFDETRHICGGFLGRGGTGGDSGSPMQIRVNGRMFAFGLFTNAVKTTRDRHIYPDIFIRTDTMCEFLKRKTSQDICINVHTPPDSACQKILTDRKRRISDPSRNKLVLSSDKMARNDTAIVRMVNESFGDSSIMNFRSNNCTFYCFFIPITDRNGRLKTASGASSEQIDLSFYDKIACSHIIYGFAAIESSGYLRTPTKNDIKNSNYGNYRLITQLQRMKNGPTVMLGIKQDIYTQFLENTEMARNISRKIVAHARYWGFSGIFLKFTTDVLMSSGFESFIEFLGEEIGLDKDRGRLLLNGKKKLALILMIPQRFVRFIWRRMEKFNSHFDAYYISADEMESSEQIPERAIPVDPLHFSPGVPAEDSFGSIVAHFAEKYVPRHKIILGLSAWTRSYILADTDEEQIPRQVADFGESGSETGQHDGKLAFQEFCSIQNGRHLNYDNISETSTFVEGNRWFSLNEPKSAAFIHKVQWIKSQFGGIGLYSIQGDDPNGNCSQGLPLHKSVADNFAKANL